MFRLPLSILLIVWRLTPAQTNPRYELKAEKGATAPLDHIYILHLPLQNYTTQIEQKVDKVTLIYPEERRSPAAAQTPGFYAKREVVKFALSYIPYIG